jgi:hypothetical protein
MKDVGEIPLDQLQRGIVRRPRNYRVAELMRGKQAQTILLRLAGLKPGVFRPFTAGSSTLQRLSGQPPATEVISECRGTMPRLTGPSAFLN